MNIVVLTGAGISAESGIDTFRDSGGLWEQHRIEDVATPEAFERDPELVQGFYNARRDALLQHAQPNQAHIDLANFERELQQKNLGQLTLITQNVDDLHERAGSKNLLHIHGELLKIRCSRSAKVFSCKEPLESSRPCPCCNEPGQLRPDIVWFGEMPMHMEAIEQHLVSCDLFIAIGTSGQVYPAAGFHQIATQCGARTIELNLEASDNAKQFDEQHYGLATEVVSRYFESLLFSLQA